MDKFIGLSAIKWSIILVSIVLLILAIAFTAKRRASQTSQSKSSIKTVVKHSASQAQNINSPLIEMRSKLLTMSPDTIGIDADRSRNGVWGVIMEMGFPEGSATLISLSDGTTSLYYSNGGGTIGYGVHDKVKAATIEFANEADLYYENGVIVDKFPFPQNEEVYFYLLTKNGVRLARAKENDLLKNDHHLNKLFVYGNEVLTQMRLAQNKISDSPD